MQLATLGVLTLALLTAAPALADPAIDGAAIERLTGAHGSWNDAEGVFKVTVPRDDMAVKVAGIAIVPAQGLSSWAAFRAGPGGAVVMGDIVVAESQVDAVLSAALDAGLEVTALHNHFLREEPRVLFLHIGGHGTPEGLAAAVGKVFEREKQTRGAAAPESSRGAMDATSLDVAGLEAALGGKGKLEGGVLKFVWGRPANVHGIAVEGAMGVNTWAAFAGGANRAVVDGDFATTEAELQPLLRSLRGSGFSIAAIHSHMTDESPRLLFVHYWAGGPPLALARGLRRALDAQHAVR
jgi:hypothetical protein